MNEEAIETSWMEHLTLKLLEKKH